MHEKNQITHWFLLLSIFWCYKKLAFPLDICDLYCPKNQLDSIPGDDEQSDGRVLGVKFLSHDFCLVACDVTHLIVFSQRFHDVNSGRIPFFVQVGGSSK